MPVTLLPRAAAAALALGLVGTASAYSAPDPAQGKGPDHGTNSTSTAVTTDGKAKGDDKSKDKSDKSQDKDKDKEKGRDDRNSSKDGSTDDNAADAAPVTDPAPPAPVTTGETPKQDKPAKNDKSTPATSGSTAPAVLAPVVPGSTLAPAIEAPASPLLPDLALGRTMGVAELRGEVLIRTPGGAAAEPMAGEAASVPSGTVVDARQGAVALASVVDGQGRTQVGRFSGGIFEVRQPKGGNGVTQIILRHGDFDACPPAAASGSAAKARTAARRKPVRSLWASDDHGRFQTKGRGSVATVRGTRWVTEDFCDGTRTRVMQGAVSVRDKATHRTVLVKAGHSYFAHLKTR